MRLCLKTGAMWISEVRLQNSKLLKPSLKWVILAAHRKQRTNIQWRQVKKKKKIKFLMKQIQSRPMFRAKCSVTQTDPLPKHDLYLFIWCGCENPSAHAVSGARGCQRTFAGVSALLLPCGSQGSAQICRLGATHLCSTSHLVGPKIILFSSIIFTLPWMETLPFSISLIPPVVLGITAAVHWCPLHKVSSKVA